MSASVAQTVHPACQFSQSEGGTEAGRDKARPHRPVPQWNLKYLTISFKLPNFVLLRSASTPPGLRNGHQLRKRFSDRSHIRALLTVSSTISHLGIQEVKLFPHGP